MKIVAVISLISSMGTELKLLKTVRIIINVGEFTRQDNNTYISNVGEFTGQDISIRVIHDERESRLVNAGELVLMLIS